MTKVQSALLRSLYALEEDLIFVLGKDHPDLELIQSRVSFATHDVMQLNDEELLDE